MNAKTMQSVFLSITMITYVIVQVDSKVKNVNNLTNAMTAKLIHAKMEESVYVLKITTDTNAGVPKVLKAIIVSLKHQSHNAPPVQTILTAQLIQHQDTLVTNVKEFHACLNHVKMEVHALILTKVLTAPVPLASQGKSVIHPWILLSV